MKRANSIDALIRKTKDSLVGLKKDYQAALHDKTISDGLKIDIKNIFENLRSCLDYFACEIFEFCYPTNNTPNNLYFPIRQTRKEFDKAIDKSYPNLKANCKGVYDFLETIQPYKDPWLGEFNTLNNKNKHQYLVEQTRTESRHVKVSSPAGGSVSWAPEVTFGKGVSVMGISIDPRTQMPVPNNQVKTEVIIWVDFKFGENNMSVLPFVEKSIESVENVYKELCKYL